MDRILETLIRLWEFDIWVFSQWWMYAPFLIPVMVYVVFFFAKWAVISAPVWLPLHLALRAWSDEK